MRICSASPAARLTRFRCAPLALAPSRNDEYMIYQSLLGAWPPRTTAPDPSATLPLADRLERFLVKALREAKTETSWDNPNEP